MNKFSNIINIVLAIAVIILFYLHFKKDTPKEELTKIEKKDGDATVIAQDSLDEFITLDSNIIARPIKIAYVNSDSLEVNLKMLEDVKNEIAAKQKELEGKLIGKEGQIKRKFNSKMEQYKQYERDYAMKSATFTDQERQDFQQKVMNLEREIATMEQTAQQDLMQYKSQLDIEFMSLEGERMRDYYLDVQKYCKKIADRLGFDFILLYKYGGDIFFANHDYDISSYVISALNKEYESNNPKTIK